jgi:capsular exopolysaccharide synthesis family protein
VTRLHEAIERARSGNTAAAVDPVPASPGSSSFSSWNFDLVSDQGATAVAPPPPAEIDVAAIVEAAPESVTADPVAEPAAAAPPAAVDDALMPLAQRLAGANKLVVLPNAEVNLVEQFRRLAAALHHAQQQRGVKTVMIASAVENEGKTLTATNLALTLSESYQRRVLLIDADLRRPSVHMMFRLDNQYGLSDTLKHVVPGGQLPIHRVSENLWIVPGGSPDSDPMSGLVSDTMQQLLQEAVEQFDWVIVDTPPVVLLPDANLLAAMVDLSLLVVRANSTPYPLSARAVEAIGHDRILGIVLNQAEEHELSGGYYYSRYRYSYGKEKKGQERRMSRWLPWRRSRH